MRSEFGLPSPGTVVPRVLRGTYYTPEKKGKGWKTPEY